MALTFAAGTMTLTSWGFSVMEIANLACAGRAVGNWLMAQSKDRQMIEFLAVDINTIITRKGLVDTGELNSRWDASLVLMKNGRPLKVSHPAGEGRPVVETMDSFTWLMTLIVAALDNCTTYKVMRSIMGAFLTRLLAESVVGTAFLDLEMDQHIQGWLSAACVRGITLQSADQWQKLARAGRHEPGNSPEISQQLKNPRF